MITSTTKVIAKAEILAKLDELQSLGTFDTIVHSQIDELIWQIGDQFRQGLLEEGTIKAINRHYGKDFLAGTLQGQALLKQFGYAGDFLMIDRIYTGRESDDLFHRAWDNYFLQCPAVKAVKNRKEYFKQKIRELRPGSLLNVASGPARDLLEVYEEQRISDLRTTCVEMDRAAIDYAKELTSGYKDRISFVNRNIFRYSTEERFDLVWSAGLFDYFDDRGFLMVLNRMKSWVNPGGQIIIGNFNADNNPSRDYMELFGEWFLNHRTSAGLIDLGRQAGFTTEQLTVEQEAEGVNLFLCIQV